MIFFLKLNYFLVKRNLIRDNIFPNKVYYQKYSPTEITLSCPDNLEEIKDLWFPKHNWLKHETREKIVLYLKDCMISEDGIIHKKLRVLRESIVYPELYKKFTVDYLYKETLKSSLKFRNPVILIWDHWAKNNYYHWIVDSLCRLMVFEKSGLDKTQDYTVLLPINPPSYILQSLKCFQRFNFISLQENKKFFCQKVYLPSYPASSGYQDPQLIQQLKNKILEQYFSYLKENDLKSFGSYIYVSRSKSKMRYVKNEKELIDFLLTYNFDIIYFEDLDFWQQVHIMYNTKILLTSHGANLTNMLFMPQGSSVIEINTDQVDKAILCYWSMANALKHNYYYIPSKFNTKSFTVDLDFLENTIKKVIEKV